MTSRVWIAALACALTACGSSHSSPPTPDAARLVDASPPVPPDAAAGIALADYQKALVAQECRANVACGISTDLASCEAAFVETPRKATILADVASKLVTYDPVAAQKCIAELDAQQDTCLVITTPYQDDATPDCKRYLVGTLAEGATCFDSSECAGDVFCVPTDDSCDTLTACCPGTCNPPFPRLAIGAACMVDQTPCVAGAYCNGTSLNAGPGTCVASTAGLGHDCLAGTNQSICVAPTYCSFDTGKCVEPAPSGAACVPTELYPCADIRDYCDSTSKCARGVAIGQACTDPADGASNPVICTETATCVNKVCVANETLGGPCTVGAAENLCPGDAECVAGTCQVHAVTSTCR